MNEVKSFSAEVWNTLSQVNVNEHVQTKMKLSYLSWAFAWGQLMEYYPDSKFEFKDPVIMPDSSVEVWVDVSVTNGKGFLTRSMWLPVMDHKNKAIKDPDARAISDTRMRCLVKCLGLFGLGFYIYAGEDLPIETQAKKDELQKTVNSILTAIKNDEPDLIRESWQECSRSEQESLWVAKTKGGYFTQSEKEAIRAATSTAGATE